MLGRPAAKAGQRQLQPRPVPGARRRSRQRQSAHRRACLCAPQRSPPAAPLSIPRLPQRRHSHNPSGAWGVFQTNKHTRACTERLCCYARASQQCPPGAPLCHQPPALSTARSCGWNLAWLEGSPQDLRPWLRASALLTYTRAAQAQDDGNCQTSPASATSYSRSRPYSGLARACAKSSFTSTGAVITSSNAPTGL